MKRIMIGLMLSSVLATTAWAGTKAVSWVVINTTSRSVYGGLGTARSSTDPYQRMGCYVRGIAPGYMDVTCFAADSTNRYATCYSTDRALVAAATSMPNDAYLSFAWDANGVCTSILSLSSSNYEPKKQ